MRRYLVAASTAAFVVVGTSSAVVTLSSAETPVPSTAPVQTPLPTLVTVEHIHPPKVLKLRDRFKVPAYPPPNYVLSVIAPYEAQKWGVSTSRLTCRIRGESGGSVNASNGQYHGVGQFAWETFHRGASSMGLHGVRLVKKRVRPKSVMTREIMSDGTVSVHKGWKVRQLVVHVFEGKIPANPNYLHAWAQVRIMARAMAGLGRVRDSEWAVRC